jgi:membrane protease YdiL (CAAX protease family)
MEISAGLAVWVALAVLSEAAQYLSMASGRLRAGWTRERLAALAPLSYLLYSVPGGAFNGKSLLALLTLALAAAYWFAVFPKSRWSQALFAGVMAAPLLFKVFPFIYGRAGDLRMDFLGQLLWIRLSVITILRDVEPEGVNFGFWPEWREWKIGAAHFAFSLPVVGALAQWLGFATFTWPVWPWWETLLRAAGTFAGILWVVALSEEFLFRGLLQQWIGILGAAALFGMAHLGFRAFPNWRFAVVAAVAGLFYGLACRRGHGIRAAMVTHALTVAVWRTLFR